MCWLTHVAMFAGGAVHLMILIRSGVPHEVQEGQLWRHGIRGAVQRDRGAGLQGGAGVSGVRKTV